MNFEYTPPQTEIEELFGGFHCINAFGKIEPGDCDKFSEFLQRTAPPPRTPIYISSEGGEVDDALKIGALIRGGWFSTNVGLRTLDANYADNSIIRTRLRTQKYCFSAATLMYLGGKLRLFEDDSRFGIHQFSFKNPSPDDVAKSQKLSSDISLYLSEMGIDQSFMGLTANVPHTEIELIDKKTLQEIGVVTGGSTKPQWTVQARNGVSYVRGERDCIYGHHKVMLSYNKETGFMFWSVIEAMGRERELTDNPLVEITLNDEKIRIDISERCEREVYGNYVHIVAKITEQEAENIAYANDIGLQVRFSQEAEMFLGAAGISTEGGSDQLSTFFKNFKK